MTEVTLTPAAADLIHRIEADHGEVVLVQDTGCVCGDAPQCRPKGLFMAETTHVPLPTNVAGLTLWRSRKLDREALPLGITIDAEPGRRGGFALENMFDTMFVTRG